MRNPPSCQLQTSEGDGEEGKEGTGRRGCGSGASHPLTFTSPAAPGALLPPLLALASPQGQRRPGLPRVPRRPRRGEAGRGGRLCKSIPVHSRFHPATHAAARRSGARRRRGRTSPGAPAGTRSLSSSILGAFPLHRQGTSAHFHPWTLHYRGREGRISRAAFIFPWRRMGRGSPPTY